MAKGMFRRTERSGRDSTGAPGRYELLRHGSALRRSAVCRASLAVKKGLVKRPVTGSELTWQRGEFGRPNWL